MADNEKQYQVTAIMGPFTGYVLTMSKAQAMQAVDDGWAMMRIRPPFDLAVPPADYIQDFSDDERNHAAQAAQAWSDAFNKGRT
jgi:hypothetical protein